MASLVGTNYYNGGWTATSFTAPSGYGYPGFGSGKYVVMKVTAATASESISGQFMVQIPIYCYSTVSSYPVRCGITTTAPNFSTTTVTTPSSYLSYNVSVTTAYNMCYFWTPKITITSGGTYYIWLWSTSSTVGYHGHSSSTGYMGVCGVALPTVGLSGYQGYYSGCNLTANYSSYKYIYATSASSGTFYKKADSGTAVAVNADTSSTSTKTIYVIRTDTDFGSTIPYYGGNAPSRSVYRFACAVYNGTDSYTVKEGNSGTITFSKSGYTFKGLTTSATSTSGSSVSYSSSSNGKVYYAVYSQTQTITYYRGSSTSHTATATRYLYGKGTLGTYSVTEPTTTCESDDSYTFQGWTNSTTSTSYYSKYLSNCLNNGGYTTLYGTYKKAGSSSEATVYYYRGNSTKNSVTKTTTIADAFYYYKGSHKGGGTTYSYGTITSTCAADSSASLVGWTSSSSSSTSSYSTAEAAFNAGNGTIYGIFKKAGSSSDSTVYYYAGSSTKNSVTKTTAVSDKYYYGAGSTSGGGTTYSYGTITTAVSGWTFIGFTTSKTTTSSSSTAKSLFDAGNTTIYGTYSKSETMTYYPQNGGSSGTASTTNYLYGTGQTTKNRPTAPTLSKTNYKLSGWGTSTTDATADTWATLWDAGTRTVYAIWVPDNHVYYGVNGAWKTARVYYGIDGEWKPVVLRYGISNSWK